MPADGAQSPAIAAPKGQRCGKGRRNLICCSCPMAPAAIPRLNRPFHPLKEDFGVFTVIFQAHARLFQQQFEYALRPALPMERRFLHRRGRRYYGFWTDCNWWRNRSHRSRLNATRSPARALKLRWPIRSMAAMSRRLQRLRHSASSKGSGQTMPPCWSMRSSTETSAIAAKLAGLGWDRTDPPCKRRYGTGSGDRRRRPRMDPREPDPDGLALGFDISLTARSASGLKSALQGPRGACAG